MMKAIMVEDCLNCPLSRFDFRGNKSRGGNIKCTTEKGNNRIIGNVADITQKLINIPNWCPLSDWKEAIEFEKEMGRI